MFGRYKKIHMVGIGGIGMSGIAQVLINLGYQVSGSDLKQGDILDQLSSSGAKICVGHSSENVKGADLVVISSAVSDQNPEVVKARELGIMVISRADMLAELMRIKHGIAIAGSHGKTSTTAMISWVLEQAGLDPTAIIGGKVVSFKSNAKLGAGEILVAEADESDRGFLKMSPSIAVITNIDQEHMERYRDFSDLKKSFIDFANKVPFYGSVVCCKDHPVVKRILGKIEKRVVTYGADADYAYRDIAQADGKISFSVSCRGRDAGRFDLPMPGAHYAQNALAAIAVADELGVNIETVRKALSNFMGIARRFQILHRSKSIVVDDYAHHPAEVDATLKAAKDNWPTHKITAVFQPHRFTRLAAHIDGFAKVLGRADRIVITKVYAAGENPIDGVDGGELMRLLCSSCPDKSVFYADDDSKVLDLVCSAGNEDQILLFMGAGSITNMAKRTAQYYNDGGNSLG